MPERVIIGKGILEREGLSYGRGDGKALAERLRSMATAPPWEALLRRMLNAAGGWPEDILIEHEEGTPAATASEWLIVYRQLLMTYGRVCDGDTSAAAASKLVYAAAQLGRLEERFFWRHGADRVTGAPPEALALQSRSSRKNLRDDPDGGRKSANFERYAEAEEGWRRAAREVAATSPVGGERLEERITAELGRRGFSARAGSTIRKAIKGIRRPD